MIASQIVDILLESEEDDPKAFVSQHFEDAFDVAAREAYRDFMAALERWQPPDDVHLWTIIRNAVETVRIRYDFNDDDVAELRRMLMSAWQEKRYGMRSSSLDKLREAEEEIDPKEFVSRPDVQYYHEVWQVTTKDVRKFLGEHGWKVLSAARRKRGSLTLVVQGVGPDQRDNLQRMVQDWLDKKFNVGGRGSPFWVECWSWDDSGKFQIDICKSDHGDVAKFGEGPHPYG